MKRKIELFIDWLGITTVAILEPTLFHSQLRCVRRGCTAIIDC